VVAQKNSKKGGGGGQTFRPTSLSAQGRGKSATSEKSENTFLKREGGRKGDLRSAHYLRGKKRGKEGDQEENSLESISP